MWQKMVPRSQKWDRAFAVLQEGLEAFYEHIQISHVQCVAPRKKVLPYGIIYLIKCRVIFDQFIALRMLTDL